MKAIQCLIFCSLCISCYAQQNTFIQYLFPQFNDGTVVKKSGETIKASMNYNTLTQEMIFEQNKQFLALDQVDNIDTVYISNTAFVPANNIFYEVAVKAPAALFVQHQTILIPPGNETGFGQTQTSAANAVSDLKSSGKAYALKLPDDYKMRSETTYWLVKKNKFTSIKNIKDVKNFFNDKTDAINTYLKANKVSFKNKDDVAKLVAFCNS